MPVEFSLSHWLSRPRQPILSQRVPGVADTTTCEIKTLCDAIQAVQAANMAADQAWRHRAIPARYHIGLLSATCWGLRTLNTAGLALHKSRCFSLKLWLNLRALSQTLAGLDSYEVSWVPRPYSRPCSRTASQHGKNKGGMNFRAPSGIFMFWRTPKLMQDCESLSTALSKAIKQLHEGN